MKGFASLPCQSANAALSFYTCMYLIILLIAMSFMIGLGGSVDLHFFLFFSEPWMIRLILSGLTHPTLVIKLLLQDHLATEIHSHFSLERPFWPCSARRRLSHLPQLSRLPGVSLCVPKACQAGLLPLWPRWPLKADALISQSGPRPWLGGTQGALAQVWSIWWLHADTQRQASEWYISVYLGWLRKKRGKKRPGLPAQLIFLPLIRGSIAFFSIYAQSEWKAAEARATWYVRPDTLAARPRPKDPSEPAFFLSKGKGLI